MKKNHRRILCSACLSLLTILAIVSIASGETDVYGLQEDPLVATVFETGIHSRDSEEVQYVILQRQMPRYAEDQKIDDSKDEIDAYKLAQKRFMALDRQRRELRRTELAEQLQSGYITDEQRSTLTKNLEILNSLADADRETADEDSPEVRAYSEQLAKAFILRWKVNRALYRQYGGRIIYQQAGPEPLDAYRTFLQEQEAMGHFKILNPAYVRKFWHYFVTDELHDFYKPGSEEEARALDKMLPEQ
mgnify:CR=1 FL=1